MTTTSAYPALVDQLLAVFTAAFPAAYIVEGGGVSSTSAKQQIYVGVDDDSTAGPAGSGEVSWATMATNHSRDEYVTVNSTLMAWAGSSDPAGRRNEAFALMGAVVNAVTTDPSLGRVGNTLYLQTYNWQYVTATAGQGSFGVISLSLTFRARI